MIDYKFNTYRVSGEKAQELSRTAYQLMRSGNAMVSGQLLGEILYSSRVEGKSHKEIKQRFPYLSQMIIKGLLRGTYAPDTFSLFCYMEEHEPEMLDRLFKGGER